MNALKDRRSVGVFPTRRAAELALEELKNSGFPMDKVSVIAKDGDRQSDIADVEVEDHDRVGNKADEGAATGAVTGGVLGGLTGLLVGLGTLAIPGIGPIMLAGAGATALATTVAGGAIGAAAGSLVGALVGLGIPEERARVYNDRVAQGEYLVIVDGTDAEIDHAYKILHNHQIEEYGVYDVPATNAAVVSPTDPVYGTVGQESDISMNPVPPSNVHTDRAAVVETDLNRTDRVASIPDKEPEVIIVDRRDESSRSI
jgi:hypothetical protein